MQNGLLGVNRGFSHGYIGAFARKYLDSRSNIVIPGEMAKSNGLERRTKTAQRMPGSPLRNKSHITSASKSHKTSPNECLILQKGTQGA